MDDEWTSVFLRVKCALRKRGRSKHDAEDIVQEAYIRLIRYGNDHVVSKPAAFLMKTALNLLECINQLPEKTRAIFLAHRIDGMSYQRIALDRGLSTSSVEKHVAKAVLLLSDGMAGWYP